MNVKCLFGKNLHEYRKNADLSQEQLAEKLEISVKHLSTLETGKCFVSAELLEKICEILSISPSALFYTTEEKSIDTNDLSNIDIIIEEELKKTAVSTKKRIHNLKSKL